jgi:hypothetical protein
VWSTADSEGEPPEVVEITADGQRGSKYELVLVIDRPDGGAIALYRSGPGAAALNR